MLILPYLFAASLVFADEITMEKYCFSSSASASKAHKTLQSLSLSSEKIDLEDKCVQVQIKSHRTEFFHKVAGNLDPDFSIAFSSAETRRSPCLLKVEKNKSLNKSQLSGSVDSTAVIQGGQRDETASEKEVMQIQTLKEFMLTIDQDTISGECRYINPDLYEIALTVTKEAKPLVPGLPPGSTVILVNPPAPPDQQTSKLQTTLQLTRGSRVELGGVLKNSDAKNTSLSIEPKAEGQKTESTYQEKVYLSFE